MRLLMRTRPLWLNLLLAWALALGLPASRLHAQGADAASCMACHAMPTLANAKGRKVNVVEGSLGASVHAGLDCTTCHNQPGDYGNVPHFSAYQSVQCSTCHAKAASTFQGSFHERARARGNPKAPDCAACHGVKDDPHLIRRVTPQTAEASCRQCHGKETGRYDTSVHAAALKAGKNSPGCTSCHETHSKNYPPSAGAVDLLCKQCHQNAMASLEKSKHGNMGKNGAPLSCASCHDVHATSNLRFSKDADKACEQCHAGAMKQFDGSVHGELFSKGKMSCLSCHKTHQLEDGPKSENYGCGACHSRAEQDYRGSAHRLARLRGDSLAASCADCHGGHRILKAQDPASPVHRDKLPETCGQCHSEKQVFTSDYVRLPISLPSYNASVHGRNPETGKPGAVCTDCHGTHNLESAAVSGSTIHRENLARTCGKCHEEETRDYAVSVHGRALGHGIKDSPSCTDCHDEHFILSSKDPKSPVNRKTVAGQTCARCHENPALASRYGLAPDVVSSFNDSYHCWAINRGGEAVAICADCHGVHSIGSSQDPTSSIHKNNVVATCAKCHPGATPTFAASYTHVLARDRRMAHDWVRLAYLWLIGLTLGGMALHNLVLYIHDLRIHYRHVKREPFIQRMQRRDVIQHMVLFTTFTGLAITGFALRFHDAWWNQALTDLGMNEENRRFLHRIFATLMILASFYHLAEILFSKRGRTFVRDMFPRFRDVKDAVANLVYHARCKGEAPGFDRFDYTQKAEYWALLWGTLVMGVTGLVLWFPALLTLWLPAWTVRVAETVHFYEAILAVSAIIIWHFFFVIVRPGTYPMSWIWITGRMPKHEWEHHHARAAKAEEEAARVAEEAAQAEAAKDKEPEA